ncbi:MAG TPA: hypothetical protein VFL93_00105 [Longimicrobiaceae bacterium]|nr:hypothetical protein [Longimicrobiaceae bacterium]
MNVQPIDLTAIVAIVMGSLTILIPVAGITARFALKPVAESIARMREGQAASQTTALLERRVALLEQQLQGMESTVGRLEDEHDFQRQLDAPR